MKDSNSSVHHVKSPNPSPIGKRFGLFVIEKFVLENDFIS